MKKELSNKKGIRKKSIKTHNLINGHEGKEEGSLKAILIGRYLKFILIEIKSSSLPKSIEINKRKGRYLKINYCHRGRCEIKFANGYCTYLIGGEMAIDCDRNIERFYYPSKEYLGFEFIVSCEDDDKEDLEYYIKNTSQDLYSSLEKMKEPWIFQNNRGAENIYQSLKYYMEEGLGESLIEVKAFELLSYLTTFDLSKRDYKRTYYSASQVKIAKETMYIINKDLSVRYTAKELAEKFAISETSLKNYFKSVYGYNFSEYQKKVRLEMACQYLRETDYKVSEICELIGYSSQSKFGAIFKNTYGLTALEYRRSNLKDKGGK